MANQRTPLAGVKIAIFDFDDTLSDTTQRRSFIERPQGEKKDWPGFYAACAHDAEREAFVQMAREFSDHGIAIAIFTGRIGSCEADSRAWLSERGIEPIHMRFRPEKSFMKSHQLKSLWLGDLKEKGAVIVCAIDDEDANIKAFADAGIVSIDAKDHDAAISAMSAVVREHAAPKTKPPAP